MILFLILFMLWFSIGFFGGIFVWTRDFDMETADFLFTVFAAIIAGPLLPGIWLFCSWSNKRPPRKPKVVIQKRK